MKEKREEIRAQFGTRQPTSHLRKMYILRLVCRVAVLGACVWLTFARPQELDVLEGMNFFRRPYVLQLLWLFWVCDMVCQLVPMRRRIPLGSQKLFRQRFQPIRERINLHSLQVYIHSATRKAYKVFLMWLALLAGLGTLFYTKLIDRRALFLLSVVFYVCDLVCVLIWCPFRLLLGNRCCTTCRIFNWDHWMMLSPLSFIPGFFTWSLVLLSLVVFACWEICVALFPERFWENSNEALKCANCKDKLCTQYCGRRARNA